MAFTDAPNRILPIAEELLENRYARENLEEGAAKIRGAYERARKRRVKPSRDRKLRRQLEAGLAALDEGTSALARGQRKPKRTGRKVFVAVVVLGGASAVLAANEDLRRSLLSSAKAIADEVREGPFQRSGSEAGPA